MSVGMEASFITDLHSHLVPGVDDGAPTVDDALEGVGRMVEREVGAIVTTPHLSGLLTHRPRELELRLGEVEEAFDTVSKAIRDRYPELSFLQGHEVMLDCPDPDLSDPRLRLGNSNVVLVEWPRLQIPPETPRVIEAISETGVQVLIAHVERYGGYGLRMALVEEWRQSGALFQCNYGAICGRYGSEARSRMVRLLEKGWVDCLATDFHGRPHLRLYMECARRTFEELHAEEAWRLLTRTNPARIVRGERPVPVPPIESEPGLLERVLSLFRS